MKSKGNIKDNCFLIVICILMISFTVNIYQAIENNKYSYELGKQNYNKIEEIRYRNESILSILESCVSAGSVNNSDLLTLHRNYSKFFFKKYYNFKRKGNNNLRWQKRIKRKYKPFSRENSLNGQANKGAGRMPWHWEPMKDVISCDKLRGAANKH